MSNYLCIDVFDADNAAAHNFSMRTAKRAKVNIPKLLRAMMDRLEVNQSGLAERLGGGISQPQISRWLKGSEPEVPPYERITELATTLGMIGDVRSEDVSAMLPQAAPPRMAKLKGYVGAGSEAHFYALADEDYEEVPAPASATDQTIAVEIKGTSLGPAFNKWLVFYDDVRSPVTDDLIGKLCVVGLDDDRILIKIIRRDGHGRFTLLSNGTEPPIENVRIEWAAEVTDMRQRH